MIGRPLSRYARPSLRSIPKCDRPGVVSPAMRWTIELRAAEGGDDAKDLVRLMTKVYGRWADRHGL